MFYCDLGLENKGMFAMLEKVHDFYVRLTELWCRDTAVDGVWALDDWGSQRSLLIHPDTWIKYFKPLYRDYVNIAPRNAGANRRGGAPGAFRGLGGWRRYYRVTALFSQNGKIP